MMRALILTLLLATPVMALDTSTEGFFPSWGGVGGGSLALSGTANAMRCWSLPARIGFTSITKLAASILGGTGAGCVFTIAIYDDTGATQMAALQGTCAAVGVKTATVPAFTLVQNTRYRLCACASKSNVVILSLYEAANAARGKVAMRNAGSTLMGVAANVCVLGVAPVTTGALSPAQTNSPPMLRLEQ